MSAVHAMALIHVLSGAAPGALDRVSRHRLTNYLRRLVDAPDPLPLLAGWLAKRAPRHDVFVNPGWIPKLAGRDDFTQARSQARPLPSERFILEGYVDPEDVPHILERCASPVQYRPNVRIWAARVPSSGGKKPAFGVALAYLADYPETTATVAGNREVSQRMTHLRGNLQQYIDALRVPQ